MRPIIGLDGYFADSTGTIYNQSGTVKATKENNCGYMTCTKGLVHRLVAAAYLGLNLQDRKIQVNHIDGNKKNDSVSNLELVSAKENKEHAYALSWPHDNDVQIQCRHCLEVKSHDDFYTTKRGRYGKNTVCIPCLRQRRKELYVR